MKTTNPTIERRAPEDAYILSYDNPHSQELIRKLNERFKGTAAELPLLESGEVYGGHMVRRAGIETILATDPNLQSTSIKPITPLDSELLLQQRKLPKGGNYDEVLGLLLYHLNGINPRQAKALYESIQRTLGIDRSILNERLLIVRPGLEKDLDTPYGVKFVILPRLTQVYALKVLNQEGEHNFEYGLNQGLPNIAELGIGDRTISLPTQEDFTGLNVLSRTSKLNLDAKGTDLSDKTQGLFDSITLAKY